MRIESTLEYWEMHVFVCLGVSVFHCVHVSLSVCLPTCVFQGRTHWWKAAHGWKILLFSFYLTDSCLNRRVTEHLSLPLHKLQHAAHIDFPLQNPGQESFFFFLSNFLFEHQCVVVFFVCSFSFSFQIVLYNPRQDDWIKPPGPMNKICYCWSDSRFSVSFLWLWPDNSEYVLHPYIAPGIWIA